MFGKIEREQGREAGVGGTVFQWLGDELCLLLSCDIQEKNKAAKRVWRRW